MFKSAFNLILDGNRIKGSMRHRKEKNCEPLHRNYPPLRWRWDQAASVAMMVLKGLEPWAAHMAR